MNALEILRKQAQYKQAQATEEVLEELEETPSWASDEDALLLESEAADKMLEEWFDKDNVLTQARNSGDGAVSHVAEEEAEQMLQRIFDDATAIKDRDLAYIQRRNMTKEPLLSNYADLITDG